MSEITHTEPAETAPPPAAASAGRAIALAAALIMIGNLSSRFLGFVRDSVIAGRFGVTVEMDLYRVLSAVPTQIYDFLVGGLVSAALIPVLSDYAEAEDWPNLWRLVSAMLTLLALALALIGGLVWLFAAPISRFMTADLVTTPALAATATTMLRVMIAAVVFMGLSGLLTGLLQSQRRFLLPAFTTSVFNLGIIAVVLLAGGSSIQTLAWGMLAGAVGQMVLQTPALRGARLRPSLDLSHPGLRRIGKLYAPVALGICFSVIGTTVDRRLAGFVGGGAATYMGYATTLIQLTLGLVSAAISLAILPTLSRMDSAGDQDGFRRVLGMGIKTVLLLITPAMVILAVLGEPVLRLILQHGVFTAENTRITALVLLIYVPSLVAAAVDQQLIFAFYARKHTLLPNLVQGLAVAGYLIVALASYRAWGVYGLVAANVVQWFVHVLAMIVLAHRRLDVFAGQGLGAALAKLLAAAGAMALVCWGLVRVLPAAPTRANALLALLAAGGLGSLAYGAVLWGLKFDALRFFTGAVGARLRRGR
ncbi:MAG TPA: murein biosynthesis integral membrane protein MurJ [Herpetosiphonaceae bacterium]